MISRICEEFSCPPDVAVRQPLWLTLRIIELRQYARTKTAVDAAKTDGQMPAGPMADLVFEVQHSLTPAGSVRITR